MSASWVVCGKVGVALLVVVAFGGGVARVPIYYVYFTRNYCLDVFTFIGENGPKLVGLKKCNITGNLLIKSSTGPRFLSTRAHEINWMQTSS